MPEMTDLFYVFIVYFHVVFDVFEMLCESKLTHVERIRKRVGRDDAIRSRFLY
jgi:hypothetical protein